MLSGIVSCGKCGGGYTVIGTNRFGCSAHKEKGTCSNNRTIAVEKLEARVLNGLKEHLLEPNMVAEYIRTYHATMKELKGQDASQRLSKEREVGEITRKIGRIIDAIENGDDTQDMRDRMKTHNIRREQLTNELKEIENPTVVEMHPRLPEMYQRRIEALHEALNEEGIRHKAIQILHTLIDKIVLHGGTKRGEIRIELHGDISALLHLMEQKGNNSGEVMKWLVAGVGFEPTTFRL